MNFKSMGGGDGEAPSITPLVRQGSSYSLTFDEDQSTLRGPEEDFGSRRMDELQMRRWTDCQSFFLKHSGWAATVDSCRGGGFVSGFDSVRQFFPTLQQTISQNTEVEAGVSVDVPRLPTYVEMTPEWLEKLRQAGVVTEDVAPLQAPQRPIDRQCNNSNVFFSDLPAGNDSSGLAPGFNQGPNRSNGNIVSAPTPQISVANLEMTDTEVRPYVPPMPLANQQAMTNSRLVGFVVPEMVGMGTTGDLSSVSPVTYVPSSGVIGRKSSGTVEKVTESRLRRMIKSRESAARSRARKQAHTMELEAEVAKLGEQNQELLKKLAEMMEMKKNQISVGRRIIGRFKSYWRWAYRGQFE